VGSAEFEDWWGDPVFPQLTTVPLNTAATANLIIHLTVEKIASDHDVARV
jgi:hypothetical protein